MSEETTLTVSPARRDRNVVTMPPEAPEEGPAEERAWFAGAVPGARPAFRGSLKIGMD